MKESVNIRDNSCHTPLWHEIVKQNSNIALIRVLLQKDADINTKMKVNGRLLTPLGYLFGTFNEPLIELLLDHGGIVQENFDFLFYFMLSTRLPNVRDFFKLFIRAGLNSNAKKDGIPLLQYAIEQEKFLLAILLVDHGASVTEYEKKQLLDWSNNNIIDKILNMSYSKKDKEYFELLVKVRLLSPSFEDNSGMPLLLYAIAKNNPELTKQLLEYGANPNVEDGSGLTVLYIAGLRNYIEITKLLLEYGADPNKKDKNGKTVLYYAVMKGQKEVVKLLLQHGVDLSLEYRDFGKVTGKTIFDIAEDQGYETIKILLEAEKGRREELDPEKERRREEYVKSVEEKIEKVRKKRESITQKLLQERMSQQQEKIKKRMYGLKMIGALSFSAIMLYILKERGIISLPRLPFFKR
jgi:ankyrin repeat protein